MMRLSRKLKALFESTRYGDPSVESDLHMGPLVNHAGLNKVADRGQGYHYEPTLLTGATAQMDIMRRETFGAVLPVQAVSGLDEAIALANDSDYGLTSSVYTRDLNAALKAARELKFGETYINRENFEAMQGFHAGRRKSGIGGADDELTLRRNSAAFETCDLVPNILRVVDDVAQMPEEQPKPAVKALLCPIMADGSWAAHAVVLICLMKVFSMSAMVLM